MRRRPPAALLALILTAATVIAGILITPTAASATVCGDTTAAWVPALGSTWTGTAGDDLILEALPLFNAAETVLGVLPLTGQWTVDTANTTLIWTGALEGISYYFQATATSCDGSGKVLAAEGSGHDSVFNSFAVTIDRLL